MTKARLLKQMRGERAKLEALVGSIDEIQMEVTPAQGEWSIKDVLAHIAAWERHFRGWFEAEAQGQQPSWPVPPVTKEDIERFNLQVYAARRGWPLAQVQVEFGAAFLALLAEAEAMPEADLLAPGRFAFAAGRPAWLFFTLATLRHYPQHYAQIKAAAGVPDLGADARPMTANLHEV